MPESRLKTAAPETLSAVPVQPLDAEAFRKRLARWYKKNARELPWRGVRDPYATWVSEIMLQQTRVATVIERYGEFLRLFPTIEALAQADESAVLACWSGLGYYQRARLLHRGAQFVMRELDGKLPRTAAKLRSLPGIGDYTAAAIASIAFRESVAVVDGNVERVLLRILGQAENRSTKARGELYQTAQSLMPAAPQSRPRGNAAGDHNQAMMELGATICLPRAPLCLQCPVMEMCRTRGEHVTAERGKLQSSTVAYLLALRKRGTTTEVLLEQRAPDAKLMPGMFELPPLPLDATRGREPILRLRHAITNTNYYVMIFAEGAGGVRPEVMVTGRLFEDEDGAVLVSDVSDGAERLGELAASLPASEESLVWMPARALAGRPLTGLARKALQRLGVMSIPKLGITERVQG